MKALIPDGAFALKDCGCVAIAEWFCHSDGRNDPDSGKRWRAFQAKAKRRGYAIETYQKCPTRDWLCGPHRAGHEAYKKAKAELVQ